MNPALWQLVAVVVAGLAIGRKPGDCRYVSSPQPAIAPGGLP
jgi:hypothetical protein